MRLIIEITIIYTIMIRFRPRDARVQSYIITLEINEPRKIFSLTFKIVQNFDFL